MSRSELDRHFRTALTDPAAALRSPKAVGFDFVYALLASDSADTGVLRSMTTPEALAAWGDFREATTFLDSLGTSDSWGIAPTAARADGALDVAYLDLMSRDAPGGALRPVGAALTLVWRPEASRWLVHALGPRVDPQYLPRTSAGTAPEDPLAP